MPNLRSQYRQIDRQIVRPIVPVLCLLFSAALAPGLLPAQTPESPRWTPLGPFGGVVNRLAAHPTVPGVLYGGGYLPGLVRTLDGGASWQVLPGTPFSPNAVGIDPSRPTTLYTADILSGNVVLKSTDGGDHWRVASRDLPSDFFSYQFEVDPSRPSRIYATGNLHGIWRSVDGGVHWQPVSQALLTRGNEVPIVAVARRPAGTVFAGTSRQGVFRSRNAGNSWEPLRNGLPAGSVTALAIAPGDPRTLYASLRDDHGIFLIFRSRDGGDSWEEAGGPALDGKLVLSIAVHPRLPRTVYASTFDANTLQGGLFKTQDGGGHWRPAADASTSLVFALAFDSAATLYAGTTFREGFQGGVLRSTDGGGSWTRVSRGIPGLTPSLASIAVDPAGGDTLVTGLNGFGVFRLAGDAEQWMRTRAGFDIPAPYGVAVSEVVAGGPGTFYAIYRGSPQIWRSTDAGVTWRQLEGPRPLVHLRADPLDPDTLYALSLASRYQLHRSRDRGASWTLLDELPDPFRCQINGLTVVHTSASAPAVLYLAGTRSEGTEGVCHAPLRSAVLRSTDEGASWTAADSGLPGQDVAEVVVDPRDSRTLYVWMNGGQSIPQQRQGVWKSTDAGASWQPTALRDQLVTALAASPVPGVLWAATQGGARIFRSEDSGATWQDRSGDIAFYFNEVQDFAFDPIDPRRVYAAGFGGVWVLEEED